MARRARPERDRGGVGNPPDRQREHGQRGAHPRRRAAARIRGSSRSSRSAARARCTPSASARFSRAAPSSSPPGAGVGSTIGFPHGAARVRFRAHGLQELDDCDWPRSTACSREMEREGMTLLGGPGWRRRRSTSRARVDLRYVGQGHEVTVTLPDGELGPASVETSCRKLRSRVRAAVWTGGAWRPLEAVNVACHGAGPAARRSTSRGHASGLGADARVGAEGQALRVLPVRMRGYRPTPVYDRYGLGPGRDVRRAGHRGRARIHGRRRARCDRRDRRLSEPRREVTAMSA